MSAQVKQPGFSSQQRIGCKYLGGLPGSEMDWLKKHAHISGTLVKNMRFFSQTKHSNLNLGKVQSIWMGTFLTNRKGQWSHFPTVQTKYMLYAKSNFSRTYWWKVLAGFGTRSATPNKIYNSCGRIEASRSFLRAAKWHKPHTSEIQMRMKKAYR